MVGHGVPFPRLNVTAPPPIGRHKLSGSRLLPKLAGSVRKRGLQKAIHNNGKTYGNKPGRAVPWRRCRGDLNVAHNEAACHSGLQKMAVCCQNLPVGAVSSRRSLSLLVCVRVKKLFFLTCLMYYWRKRREILV